MTLAPALPASRAAAARCQFLAVTLDPATGLSPVLPSRVMADEAIVSWNAAVPPGAALRVELRAIYPDHATKFYDLGFWTGDGKSASAKGQKDIDGDVSTDTLILKKPTNKFQVRVTTQGGATVKFVGLSLLDSRAKGEEKPPNKQAWGKTLNVPQRSQLAFKDGSAWCSPTSTTMVMAYWAAQNNRPGWLCDVPGAAKAMYDTAWSGTGNWPFNTAFAGGHDGLRAYVTRLGSLRDVEEEIVKGVPVVCSVTYNAAAGDDSPGESGHILVVVGFSASGDVVVNDPWAHLDKGQSVRKTFGRANFTKMWAHSHQTVYLIYPTDTKENF